MNLAKNRPGCTVRVLIAGRVQGVGFRAWIQRNASALELNGWVRNRRNGAVEAVFSGSGDRVGEMLERCRKGPPSAIVADMTVFEGEAAPAMGFSVLPAA